MKLASATAAMCLAAALQSNATAQGIMVTDALIPIEVLALDPAFVGEVGGRGFRWDSAILASQPARIARGIVLTEPASTLSKGTTLNLVILGQVEADTAGKAILDVPPDRIAWCENPVNAASTLRCFRDLDGDSKLDAQATGYLAQPDALSLNRLGPAQPRTPVAYRPATADELMPLRLEYASCPTTDETLRYAVRIRRVKVATVLGGAEQRECTQLAKLVEDRGAERVYVVGRMRIAVGPESDGKRATRIVEGIPTGALLGHVRTDRQLTDAIAVTGYSQEVRERATKLPTLYFVNTPELTSDSIVPGATFLSVEVAHGLTGRLSAPVYNRALGSKSGPYFETGTALFGVEMGASSRTSASHDAEIVWCAPNRAKERTECMVSVDGIYRLERTRGFDVRVLSVGNSNALDGPIVERGPVSFGAPLILDLRFDRWDKRGARVSYSVDLQNKSEKRFDDITLKQMEDGSAWLLVGGALLRISPSASSSTAATIAIDKGALKQRDEAYVTDGYDIALRLRK